MIFESIIACEFPANVQLDYRRVQHIFPIDTIKEIDKQIKLIDYLNQKLKVLLHVPLKQYIANGTSNKRKVIKNLDKSNGIIGELLSNSLELNPITNTLQCKAIVEINEESAVETIIANKSELCFFPLIAYNPEYSLEKIKGIEEDAFYLHMPFKVQAIALGTIRGSSNPFLKIL